MSITPFNRDTAYFQIMRDRSMMINAEDLDFQFNNLTDYLNKKIVPLVNGLISLEIKGVNDPNLVGACLLNIGNGTTQWLKVNTNVITDYSIPLSKFTNYNYDFFGQNIGSILATDNSKVFMPIPPLEGDNVLLSRLNSSPIWRKIETGDILNRSIAGINIALNSIGLEHLSAELIGIDVTDNSILTNFIKNANITGDKLLNGSITENKISADLINERKANVANNNNFIIADNALENRHFNVESIAANSVANGGSSYMGVPMQCVQVRSKECFDDLVNYTFTSDNIIDGSIDAATIVGWITAEEFIEDGAIENRHIQDYSVSLHYVNKVPNEGNLGTIPKECLDPAIRAKLGLL
jgi:hypothetical protein